MATTLSLRVDNSEHTSSHHGVGPVEAVTEALARIGISLDVLALHQTSIGSGNDSDALTLIEYRRGTVTRWAAGKNRSVLTATLESLIGAANTDPKTALTR